MAEHRVRLAFWRLEEIDRVLASGDALVDLCLQGLCEAGCHDVLPFDVEGMGGAAEPIGWIRPQVGQIYFAAVGQLYLGGDSKRRQRPG